MQILDVIQGEEPWHAARAKYRRTASIAPAVMGCSKNKTRASALKFLATGIEQEFSQWVQENLLDRGHLIEGYSKPLAESIIGKKLYPTTAISDDEFMLASFDGLSADDEDAWECKSWNEKKAAEVRSDRIPEEDYWQVVQQLAIGAQRCLYMVTDGTEEKTVYCWLKREDIGEDIERLIAGWNQMDKDVESYVPPVVVKKPVADAIMQLPAVIINATGSLTASNIEEMKPRWDVSIFESKARLDTIDIVNGKAIGKFGRETAKALKTKAKEVVDQIATVSDAVRTLEFYAAEFDSMGLSYENAVIRLKKEEAEAAINKVRTEYADHLAVLQAGVEPIRLMLKQPDFAFALKNLRTVESKNNALNTALATAKIEADMLAKDIRAKLAFYRGADSIVGINCNRPSDFEFLFADLQSIIQKPIEDFKLIVQTRILTHKQAEAATLETERVRIRDEEEAKARAKIEAEEREAIAIEERRKAVQLGQQTKPTLAKWPTPIKQNKSLPAPSRSALVKAVAFEFGVEIETALQWLSDEFGIKQ